MPRPISVVISSQALRHNINAVLQYLESTSQEAGIARPKAWAVIKANAYGHGIDVAVPAFEPADGLAMLDLDEAVRCRDAGWSKPILLLEGFFEPQDLELVQAHSLTVAVHSSHQLDMLEHATITQPINVFLKLNTGMNRLGFAPSEFANVWRRLHALKADNKIATIGKMTHFARADDDVLVSLEQKRIFEETVANVDVGPFSLCNSAGIYRPELWTSISVSGEQWVRPGLCLYGCSPLPDRSAASIDLIPVQTLRAEILTVRDISPGEAIGYGHLFVASEPMRMGVVSCGYGDGYPRLIGPNTPVTVDGVATNVVGRVSMDMITVDLTHIPQAQPGTPVIMWGEGGPSVDVIAACANTIGYDLMCAVAPRVPRIIA